MIRKSSLLIAAVGMFVLSAAPLQAANRGDSRVDIATRKLGRGISNIVFSPVEIVNSVYTVQRNDGEVAAVTYGVLQGLTRTVARIGIGAYEVVTFPVGRRPIITPEFPARGGVLNAILEPHRTYDYPESDEWKLSFRRPR